MRNITLKFYSGFLLMAFILINSCSHNPPLDLSKIPIIPKPKLVEPIQASFELKEDCKIVLDTHNKEVKEIADSLSAMLQQSTGFKTPVVLQANSKRKNNIMLKCKGDQNNPDAYEIRITPKQIIITGAGPSGVYYGIQTLRQILPVDVESKTVVKRKWFVACGSIYDEPRFKFRSAMLDVSRHFFDVNQVKKYIKQLAFYKINHLHLHLSDDQGWRIEIKSWPRLTTIGGSTEVGGGPGGYYTQNDYKEIIRFAKSHQITIIPEIDMPGHTNAALASYPRLNCDDKARELYTGTDVGFSSLCTTKEITYEFIENVVSELCAMTPGKYLHIGGDESHATPHHEYAQFIARVQAIVHKHKKTMIGWKKL